MMAAVVRDLGGDRVRNRDPLPRRRGLRSGEHDRRGRGRRDARQGTINGYGERCGNANWFRWIANLQLKLGHECLTEGSAGER